MSNLEELITTLNGIEAGNFKENDIDRLKLIEAAKKLLVRVEAKEERWFDLVFSQPIVFAALEILLDLGLWQKWTVIDGASKSVDELCELCTPKCDLNLLRRLLKLLASVNIIAETNEDHFALTHMWHDDMWKWIASRTVHWSSSAVNFPRFLAKTGYKEPHDPINSNYADQSPGHLHFFDRCVAEPASQEAFSDFMKGWATYKVPWPTFYDTDSLMNGADLSDGGVLCVDIGGHHGIDLTRLLDKHPDLPPGSLVLEDLPEVVNGAINLNEKIKVIPHDMFKPQPVKGSRAYYFHAVFHDWSDSAATQILKNTVEVMKRGYSRVLIQDMVLPVVGATAIQSTMDVEMMSLCSAYERTEGMWTKVITDAGLKIIKIWQDGRGNEGLIEAELA
ncbi:putative O-methyltransferase [Xylaria bambusicola]|uniref:putative O-methyltransferase n=1 Tax=Xylaria bambusicola TaxID=326684 RepID=UPI002008DB29|nr:putative O-methyltransferase [Xylaria bambusicola]KAI0514947.1 putative O-methyltransferase [Xylaria bambusicola]